MTREVWRIDKAGSLGRLLLKTEKLDPPASGQARVRIHAIGLNFADIFACLGLYSATPEGSFIPGLEFSGVVEEFAGDCSDRKGLRVGDRVIGLTRFGAYATHLNAGLPYLRQLPANWTFEEGAAFAVQALTAWYAIDDLGALREGQVVLIHSAAGGVGLHAVALALGRSARVIATVGNPAKVDFLCRRFQLSPDQVIVRDRRRFAEQLKETLNALGESSIDLVLDAVAGPYFEPAYQMLAPAGRLVLFGAADMMPARNRPNYLKLLWQYLRRPRLDPLEMIAENRSLMAFNLIWLWDRHDLLAERYQKVAASLPDPPYVGRTFEFRKAPEAMRFLQSGQSIGKVVLVSSPDS